MINTLDSFEKGCCIPEAFHDALVKYQYCGLCKLSKISKLSSVIFFLLTKEIDSAAKNLKLNYFSAFCSKNCSGSVTLYLIYSLSKMLSLLVFEKAFRVKVHGYFLLHHCL